MAQSQEPSYLLADFPPTDDRPHDHGHKDPNATQLSLESPDAPANHEMHDEKRDFKRKFMPGRFLADCTATLVPIALLVFAIVIMRLDKKETEKEEFHRWRNAITVIASIFPIVFASIVGRMVFESARWKLEKGATLDLLEQLIGSRTVGSTFTTQISLGKFNILGLMLLLIWAFSPLGSQSVLRMLGSRLEQVNTDSGVTYFSTDAASELASDLPNTPESGEGQAINFSYIKTMFTSLFVASAASKSDPMDLWGNVKIPNLAITDNDWHDVPSSPGPDSYSALIGLPITNVTTGNMTFSLESSYLNLECYNMTISNTSLYIPFNWTNPPAWGEYEQKQNGTWHGYNDSALQTPWAMAVDRFVDPYWASTVNLSDRFGDFGLAKNYYGRPVLFENETDLYVKPSRLLFNSAFQRGPRTSERGFKVECHVFQRYVESRVHCSRVDTSFPQNCSVTAQRLSRMKHATENITSLSWETVWSRVSSLPGVMDGARRYADIAMRFLDNPLLSPVSNKGVVQESELFEGITLEQFGRRFSQVINTYLLVGQVYGAATEADSNFDSNITVPAEVGNLVEIYTVNWTWMALFVVSCVILLASGITSIVFAYLAIGPEILGYASSVVRDSKYIDLPVEAGKKEAFEVVKIMGQKRLKYGYVDSVAEESQSLVGVGLESETRSIHKR